MTFLKKRWDCLSSNHHLTAHQIAAGYIDKTNQFLSVQRQAQLLGIARSAVYYQPQPVSEEDICLMNLIDQIHTDFPYYGARRVARQLTDDLADLQNGSRLRVGRKRAGSLMALMGIEALYQKPNLSKNSKPHPHYPYLLKRLKIDHPNQVVGADITYIRLKGGFLYLVVFLDWYSRFVLSWGLSPSLETAFCLKAAKELLEVAIPDIINTDQGTQFTDEAMLSLWLQHQITISMDHRGRCFDNIFTERFWRSLKYEEVYLKDYQNPLEAEIGIGNYINQYNYRRLHQSLGYKTPAEVYFGKEVTQPIVREVVANLLS